MWQRAITGGGGGGNATEVLFGSINVPSLNVSVTVPETVNKTEPVKYLYQVFTHSSYGTRTREFVYDENTGLYDFYDTTGNAGAMRLKAGSQLKEYDGTKIDGGVVSFKRSSSNFGTMQYYTIVY